MRALTLALFILWPAVCSLAAVGNHEPVLPAMEWGVLAAAVVVAGSWFLAWVEGGR